MTAKLKLYVWEDVLTDYTSGVMFALARSADEARRLITKAHRKEWGTVTTSRTSPTVVADLSSKPMVVRSPRGFLCWGGG